MENTNIEEKCTLAGGTLEPPSRRRPGRRARQRAPGGWAGRGARLGTARSSDMATSLPRPPGRTICEAYQWGWVHCHQSGSESGQRQWTGPGQQRLSLGTWNVTKLVGKGPEIVREVEQ